MNIYSTGMNPADSNTLKRDPRVSIFQAYVEMMRYLQGEGHTIIWRATKVGDMIPANTEVVMVSSMLPRSLNCPYALGVIWTISEALKRDIPLILYLTDWAFFKANSEFRSIAKAGEEYFFKTIGGSPQYKEDPTELRTHASDLLDVCRQYGDPNSKLWSVCQPMVPRYTNWGDVNIVQKMIPGARPFATFDPTPLFVEYLDTDPYPPEYVLMESRKKRWLLPSLLKDDTWIMKQRLRWDVDRMGPKGFQVVSTERIVQAAYRMNVGGLCPPYAHEGSGWWRSRWIHSARAGSILLAGDKDVKVAGPEYNYAGPYIECQTVSKLKDIAQAQHDRMNSLLQLNPEIMRSQIYTAIREAGA